MKLLKTNTNQYKDNFKKHITTMFYYNGGEFANTIDKFLICFNQEHNFEYNKRKFPNLQDRLADYLQGCPYGFNISYNYEILDFACVVHELSSIPEDKQDVIIENFYNHCSCMILRLADKQIIKILNS